MSILSWILLGLLVGLVAGLAAGRHRMMEDSIVGVVGSIIGGWLFVVLTAAVPTEPSLPGTIPALLGAALFVAVARTVLRGRTAI